MAATGIMPCLARPPAMEMACSSAMPTSKVRSGNRWAKAVRPVPADMAAVMAQTRLSWAARSTMVWPKESEKLAVFSPRLLPVAGSNFPMPWNLVGSS